MGLINIEIPEEVPSFFLSNFSSKFLCQCQSSSAHWSSFRCFWTSNSFTFIPNSVIHSSPTDPNYHWKIFFLNGKKENISSIPLIFIPPSIPPPPPSSGHLPFLTLTGIWNMENKHRKCIYYLCIYTDMSSILKLLWPFCMLPCRLPHRWILSFVSIKRLEQFNVWRG